MTLNEKASYIKGLIEGFELDKDKKENRAIYEIVELLQDMADSITELENSVDDVSDQIEELTSEIEDIEECHCHEDDDCDCGCDCDCDNEPFYEVECPSCNTKVCLSEDVIMKEDVTCPNCGENIDIDFGGCDCDDCDCDDCDCE